jgi:hypothetical protein
MSATHSHTALQSIEPTKLSEIRPKLKPLRLLAGRWRRVVDDYPISEGLNQKT